jgi:hypothetical protein
MNDFIAKYKDQLTGTLSGFDRLVFRGSLWKDQLSGMKGSPRSSVGSQRLWCPRRRDF